MFFNKKKENNEQEKKNTTFKWNKIFFWSKIDEKFFETLEENLISADVGGKNAIQIIDKFKNIIEEKKIKDETTAKSEFKNLISNYFKQYNFSLIKDKLNIFTFLGVNGVGKTTNIAKFTNFLQNEYTNEIILSAADTFRAAAREQLEYWGKKTNVRVIGQKEGADPASVVYDSVDSAINNKKDVLIIDTAGRMHNKENLINQLIKMNKVIEKFNYKTINKNVLILDGVSGQNAFSQAELFKEKVGIDFIIITKLDTSAKGGILIKIAEELDIPIGFISYGEKIEEFKKFDFNEYIDSIL